MAGDSQIRLLARWMIGLSIALNIFLLVFLGAQTWHYRHPGFLASVTGQSIVTGNVARTFVDEITSKLPADDARRLRNAFAAKLPSCRN